MIIMDCPLHIDFIQRLLANNRDCWTHGKSLIVTIAPGIQVPINCYLRSSQKKLAKLSPGRALAALEGFIREVNLRKSREYDDDPELVEPVIVEDVQDLIPLMSLRILKDRWPALGHMRLRDSLTMRRKGESVRRWRPRRDTGGSDGGPPGRMTRRAG